MSDNLLKKQFNKKDVKRMRNLIKGKFNEKTAISVGYNSKIEKKNEGDVWEESGKTWTIKNGVRKNVTKFSKAKQYSNFPLFCPNCGNLMKNRNDKSFYKIHGKCFNCVVDHEANLRKQGKFKDYEKKIKNSEIDNIIKEYKIFIKEQLEENNTSFVSENGKVEDWQGYVNKELVDKYSKEVIEYLLSLKEE